MKKIILVMTLMFLGSCFLGEPFGYENIEIKNLASPNLIIEGMEYGLIDDKTQGFFPVQYKGDPSVFIGISHYGIIPHEGRVKEPKFQRIKRLKIYYKSKKCLLFYLDENNKDIFAKYDGSFEAGKILTITKNGLELLTKDQYESAKGKYTINDSNVNCLKQ
jgi:hypothetical protein